MTTETSSLQQFLPDVKGCISKLERTVEETKIILEGTGRLRPQILESPPIIELDEQYTPLSSQRSENLTPISQNESTLKIDFSKI